MTRPLGISVIFSLIGLKAISADTNDWGYAPFLNGHEWPPVPLVSYVEIKSNVWVHPRNPKAFPSITERVEDDDADFATVVLRFPDGRTFRTYNSLVLGPYLCAVYSGDFNNDDIPDFLAIKPTGMNGIGGWYSIGIFAFSQGKDYRFTRVYSWGLGPQSLVLDPATKGFRFIHTSFRQGKGLDGRDHSFWVHRFFSWNSGGFQADEKLSPIWIQFTERPNHEATKLLTPELKSKIWAHDWRFENNIQW
jgi:hypothetical protein